MAFLFFVFSSDHSDESNDQEMCSSMKRIKIKKKDFSPLLLSLICSIIGTVISHTLSQKLRLRRK